MERLLDLIYFVVQIFGFLIRTYENFTGYPLLHKLDLELDYTTTSAPDLPSAKLT